MHDERQRGVMGYVLPLVTLQKPVVARLLERQPELDLDDSRRARARQAAEVGVDLYPLERRCGDGVAAGVLWLLPTELGVAAAAVAEGEVRVVERIVELAGHLEAGAFRQMEITADFHVPVVDSRPAEDGLPGVAVLSERWSREHAGIKIFIRGPVPARRHWIAGNHRAW